MDILKGNCTRSTNEDIRHLIKKLSNLANYTISSLIYLIRFSMITNLLQGDFLAEILFKFSTFPFNRDSISFDHSPFMYKILFSIR